MIFRLLACLISLSVTTAFAQTTGVRPAAAPTSRATFAGGCFWCMEPPFDKLPGVTATISGYTGGAKVNPTYQEVSAGSTGHTEAVQVIYDPKKVTYEKLLEVFWVNVDPTVKDRQFCDSGTQYRTSIFYHDDAQRKAAEASKATVQRYERYITVDRTVRESQDAVNGAYKGGKIDPQVDAAGADGLCKLHDDLCRREQR